MNKYELIKLLLDDDNRKNDKLYEVFNFYLDKNSISDNERTTKF